MQEPTPTSPAAASADGTSRSCDRKLTHTPTVREMGERAKWKATELDFTEDSRQWR